MNIRDKRTRLVKFLSFFVFTKIRNPLIPTAVLILEKFHNSNGDLMKSLLRYALPLLAVCLSFSSTLSAECDLRKRDFEVVEEFLNSKRTIPLNEKACNLTISGDVRVKWRYLSEKIRDHHHEEPVTDRECRKGDPRGKNHFDAVFDLYLDYVADRAWGVAWIQLNNSSGIEKNGTPCCNDVRADRQQCGGSGECSDLCLRKAYMGYNICASGCTRIDVELGRRPLWTVFDSRIQFGSRFDGLLLRYSTGFDCWGDFYANIGAFVVDDRVEHFSYVGEVGLMNIMDMGFDLKYSFIYWPGKNKCKSRDEFGGSHNARGFEYENSQVTLYYNFSPELICEPASLYAAVLYNSKARHSAHHDREDRDGDHDHHHKNVGLGWYVGFIVGEVRQEGDWALDIDYEYVQPFAVMDCDVSSDNACGSACGGGRMRRGNTANYRGWRCEGLYALTDNLTLDGIIEGSKSVNKHFGGRCSTTKFRLEALYAF
jgi:hypothetical protein